MPLVQESDRRCVTERLLGGDERDQAHARPVSGNLSTLWEENGGVEMDLGQMAHTRIDGKDGQGGHS